MRLIINSNNFSETVNYQIPKYDTLKAQFAAAAEINAKGNAVKVGRYTASKRGFFAGGDWQFDMPDNKTTLIVKDSPDARDIIIDILAGMEAEAQIPDEDRKKALIGALEGKLAWLKKPTPQP